MLIKMKVSSYFEFGEFDSLELFEDYNCIEELVYKNCFINLGVSQEDINVYKSLRPKDFSIDKAMKEILKNKKECVIDNIYSNFKEVFTLFITSKEDELHNYCKKIKIFIGDENFCKSIDSNDVYGVVDSKLIKTNEYLKFKSEYIYFNLEFCKLQKGLRGFDFKKISKKKAKFILESAVRQIIEVKYSGEELEQFIYSGEYDWIERINYEG